MKRKDRNKQLELNLKHANKNPFAKNDTIEPLQMSNDIINPQQKEGQSKEFSDNPLR